MAFLPSSGKRTTLPRLFQCGSDGNEFSFKYFQIIFIRCNNDSVTTVTVKKTSHLFVFSIYDLSFSFHSNIFLPIQNTSCTHGTVDIVVTADSLYHFYHFVKLKAMTLTYIYIQGKTCKRVAFCGKDTVTIMIFPAKSPGLQTTCFINNNKPMVF